MLCSVGKSGSNNWLDRLRSSKGFPVAGDLSLDHFLNDHHNNPNLTPNNSSNTNISGSLTPKPGSTRSDEKPVPQINQPAEISTTGDDDGGEKEWFGIMTNVLSELFNMGDSDSIENSNSTFSRKKSSRKQTNPRFCVLPSIESKSIDRRDEGVAAAAEAEEEIEEFTRNDVNCTENEDRMVKREGNVDCLDGEDEKCNGGGDLLSLGYSKSEVTIIDTSCSSWKFDKLLFRKKNVWKVRDKKGRSRNVGRKRKAIPSDDDVVGGKKIAKISMMISPPFHDDGNGADCVVPLNEGRNPQNDKREEKFQETPNILGQIPEKRFQFPRSARKTSKGGTSGVHKKGVC